MILQGKLPFLREKNHVIALVGAGGKTALLYALAEHFAKKGARTLVTTTTHIYRPEGRVWAGNPEEVRNLWAGGSYAVVGQPCEGGKLKSLEPEELKRYAQMAETVLLEADGAKNMPCKVPAGHEPVIPEFCDLVIGVLGMDAVGRPLREVCFRQQEAVRLLGITPDAVLDAEKMAEILLSEEGTRKNVGGRPYYVVLNKCDSPQRIKEGEAIRERLRERGFEQCVLTSFLEDRALE
ncbi:MAG: selenium cofactor biosynthesis protein YqeC [Eubacteriales bacterium]|nr:selenium cofactor biosynthesis protein YqeC [Eubacteriales bacterium]